MTPTKKGQEESGCEGEQSLRKPAAATVNLTDMASKLSVEGSGSETSSMSRTLKRLPLDEREAELSIKKSKVLQGDISDKMLNMGKLDPEEVFMAVKNGTLFEDRTLIIKDFVEDKSAWIIDNKPHRFGKTTNMCLMILYLSRYISLKDKSLFKGLKIGKVQNFEKKYFQQCNVLYLDLRIGENEHVFGVILTAFRNCFDSIKKAWPKILPNLNVEFDSEMPTNSLLALLNHLKETMPDSPRYLFIDEYDSAFMELNAIFNNESEDENETNNKHQAHFYAKEIYALLDKGNSNFGCRFFLTGIVSLNYDNLFSDSRMIFCQTFDINIEPFFEYHLISMEKFFSLEGLDKALLEPQKNKLIEWYGGYTFIRYEDAIGDYLNLYSLIKCCSSGNFRHYFNVSGCTKWLRAFLQGEFVVLCLNEILSTTDPIKFEFQENPCLPGGRDDVLSLLVKCGYLVFISKKDSLASVKIPNKECRYVLNSLVRSTFSKYLPPAETSHIKRNLCKAFRSGSEDKLREAIGDFFYAVQGNIRYEETYGILFFNSLQDFEEIEATPYDTPAGAGKCDGVVRLAEKGYVVEFKRCPSKDLPPPDTTSPEIYDTWCYNKGMQLIKNAENQVINQHYLSILCCKPTITTKYHLMIACIQKRVFVKLTQV